ncbi:hypothetical protein GCM10009574_080260 [Streptomyces asiaticus]|uniref:Uncharacterized protein n=2 Tax=Streptomyces rhizosphaericus TaxID=114699 RepID=A0ABN1QGU1_9ACTN
MAAEVARSPAVSAGDRRHAAAVPELDTSTRTAVASRVVAKNKYREGERHGGGEGPCRDPSPTQWPVRGDQAPHSLGGGAAPGGERRRGHRRAAFDRRRPSAAPRPQ